MADIPTAPDALLQWVLDKAKKHGATSADALYVEGQSTEVGVRLGDTEKVKRSQQKGVGLRIFKEKSTATTSTMYRHQGKASKLMKKGSTTA